MYDLMEITLISSVMFLYLPSNLCNSSVLALCNVFLVGRLSTMDDTSKVEDVHESHTLLLTPSCNAVDITENKDGGILKELLKESSGDELPLLGDQVTITYDAMFADGNRFDSSHFRSDNKFEFILGKGEKL